MLGVDDPVAMLEIDLAAWGALAEQDRRAVERIKGGREEQPFEAAPPHAGGAGSWLKPQTITQRRRPEGSGGESHVT
jgi:hypothetical protein